MAARVQEAERTLDEAQQRQAAAAAAAAKAFAEAANRAAALAPMMPAMRRLAIWPTETLLAQPAPPDEALRGLLVLQGMARQIRAEAEDLRLANAEAERRARIAAAEATVVAAAEAELRKAATALDEEITETRLREREARATQRAEAARAQEAHVLDVSEQRAEEGAKVGRPEQRGHGDDAERGRRREETKRRSESTAPPDSHRLSPANWP
jgi:hypothetical protein